MPLKNRNRQDGSLYSGRYALHVCLTGLLWLCLYGLIAGCGSPKLTGPDQPANAPPTNAGVLPDPAITAPPASLGLDTFYKKYLDASGIPVISSGEVPDRALYAVKRVVDEMVSFRPDVLSHLLKNKMRVGIIGISEVTTDMPEYRDLEGDTGDGRDWNETRGLGATIWRPLSSCAEENVLCYGEEKDGYYREDILIHELAHSIHVLGIAYAEPGFEKELQETFDLAIARGLWKNTYAATNPAEYFAEGVQDWFNINASALPADGIHNEIHTRDQLKSYDPRLYNLIKRFFSSANQKISCHQ